MTDHITTAPVENAPQGTVTLGRWAKLIYGTGDWGKASFNTLRQVFYAIFLTDVVGLDPRLASVAAFVAIIWDAINDPLVGSISDSLRTRWGRRRPFLLFFAIPFGLAFSLMWWAPPWQTQALLALHVTLAYMISDTIQTLVTVPYMALTPEVAQGYDERTSLTGYRMFFNLMASMITAVAAPTIVSSALASGLSMQQGYLMVAALFGVLGAIPFLVIFFVIREQPLAADIQRPRVSLKETARILWKNTPFRFATGIYVLNWIAFDLIGLMLPYFLIYWVAGGNLMQKVELFGARIELQSVVLGLLMLTAVAALPLWTWVSHRYNKRVAYIGGMGFWVVVELLILTIQPGQFGYIAFLTFLAGISVSVAHVLPDAIFPDVIDWDEARTNTRREGMYYGAVNFIRKLSTALASFLALQVLGWVGYHGPVEGATQLSQSPQTLAAIRVLTGPAVAVLLIGAIAVTYFYPLTRERQARIRELLKRRKERRQRAQQGHTQLEM